MGEPNAMKATSIIGWVDGQYGSYPQARYVWASLITWPWVLVLLFRWHPIAVAMAALWTVFWTGLYGWRAANWLQKPDKRWQRRRKQ